MKKQTIKLTESKLRALIEETVKSTLKEYGENKWDNHNAAASQNSIEMRYDYEGELWDEETGWHGYLVQNEETGFYNIEDENTEELLSPEWFEDIIKYDQEYPRMMVLVNGQKRIFDYRLKKFTK